MKFESLKKELIDCVLLNIHMGLRKFLLSLTQISLFEIESQNAVPL